LTSKLQFVRSRSERTIRPIQGRPSWYGRSTGSQASSGSVTCAARSLCRPSLRHVEADTPRTNDRCSRVSTWPAPSVHAAPWHATPSGHTPPAAPRRPRAARAARSRPACPAAGQSCSCRSAQHRCLAVSALWHPQHGRQCTSGGRRTFSTTEALACRASSVTSAQPRSTKAPPGSAFMLGRPLPRLPWHLLLR